MRARLSGFQHLLARIRLSLRASYGEIYSSSLARESLAKVPLLLDVAAAHARHNTGTPQTVWLGRARCSAEPSKNSRRPFCRTSRRILRRPDWRLPTQTIARWSSVNCSRAPAYRMFCRMLVGFRPLLAMGPMGQSSNVDIVG
jgi:hypothetical protein